jgi:hypothetical protein
VTQVDKNANGSMTYHFAVKLDQGETLSPGESKATADFVTVSSRARPDPSTQVLLRS